MSASARIGALLALCWLGACNLLGACKSTADVGSDCEDEGCIPPVDGGVHVASNLPSAKVPSGDIERVDLLLVIHDTTMMTAQQQALAGALPHFFQKLVSGDLDEDKLGTPEFHAARDLHVAVVSSNMGDNLGNPLSDCAGVGFDAVLQGANCSAQGDTFSALAPGGDVGALAMEVSCRIGLGNTGCRFPQPLEAALQAVAPAPIGHALDINTGFLRDDSLLIVIVVAEGEDCSDAGTHLFAPADSLEPNDPLAMQGLAVRCALNPNELQPLTRYVAGLASAHAAKTDGVMFFALGGVPPELVSHTIVAGTALEDESSREAFYRSILNAPAMNPTVDNRATPQFGDDEITPVCNTERGLVRPSRRIIEVARGFGVNGLVQSICESNLARPLDEILRVIARRLGPMGI